jgi:hypothetical protein
MHAYQINDFDSADPESGLGNCGGDTLLFAPLKLNDLTVPFFYFN